MTPSFLMPITAGPETRTGRQTSMLAVRIGLCLAAMWSILALIVFETHRHAWADATTFGIDVAALIETSLARELQSYDLSLTALSVDATDPSIATLPPALKRKVLFDQSSDAPDLGSMMVLDRDGRVVASSRDNVPIGRDFSDREYFQRQRDDATLGLFISSPFISRTSGQESIGISRRLASPDGSFKGVAVGTIRVSLVRSLFDAMRLPPGSSVTLMRRDGTILARVPFRRRDLGLNVMVDGVAEAMAKGAGTYRRLSATDGVDRLFALKRVDGFPLYVAVGLPTEQILASWRWEMAVIGMGFAFLTAIIILLGRDLSGEFRRRGDAEMRLADLASTDYLTMLANRRRFDEVLALEWRRCARARTPLSLLMVDGDFFKSFNDTYGHVEGDRVLRALAVSLRTCVDRPGDLVARYGGEEFAVLLPQTQSDGAMAVAEAIRAAVVAMDLVHALSPTGFLTVSIGVSTRVPDASRSGETLVEAADAALYRAKESGRNHVCADLGDASDRARRAA